MIDNYCSDNINIYEIDKIASENQYIHEKIIFLRSIEHILNLVTIRDNNNNYMECKLSDLIKKINNINEQTKDEFLFDEIIYLIKEILPIFKNIIYSPRCKLIKENVKIPANKLKGMPLVTSKWLNKQPGRNFYEKMKGKNKVLSERKKISYDIKENKVFMFYIEKIYSIIENRQKFWSGIEEYYKNNDEVSIIIADFIDLIKRLKHTELYEVKGQMYEYPNNALIDDKNYSMVWKGVNKLIEYNRNLSENITLVDIKLSYIVILFTAYNLYKFNNFKLLDLYGKLFVNNGDITFLNSFEEDKIINIFSLDNENNYLIKLVADKNIISINIKNLKENSYIFEKKYNLEINYEDKEQLKLYSDHNLILKIKLNIEGINKLTLKIRDEILKNLNISKKNTKNSNAFQSNKFVCIDFSSYLPKISRIKEDKNVYAIVWKNIEGENEIFYPDKDSIYPFSKIDILPMRDILYENINDMVSFRKIINEALSDILISDNGYLLYLIPDNIDEFSQKNLKSIMNSVTKNKYPVWRSIASTYYLKNYFENPKDQKRKLEPNKKILVFDFYLNEVSPTLVKTIKSKKNNIIFEHHSPYKSLNDEINFMNYDIFCEIYFEKIIEKYNLDIQENEKNNILKLGIIGKIIESGIGQNYIIERNKKILNLKLEYDKDIYLETLEKAVKILEKYIKSGILEKEYEFILILGDHIQFKYFEELIRPLLKKFYAKSMVFYINQHRMLMASNNINNYLKQGLPAWKEYLPKLSLEVIKNGHYEEVVLVNNKSVDSIIGKREVININNEEMVLKALSGEKAITEYRFPLVKGNLSKNGKQFYAKIEDKSFPLKEDVRVKMEVCYQYGDEESYEVYVMPIEQNSSFSKIKVIWEERTIDKITIDFPKIVVKESFEKIYKKIDEFNYQLSNCVQTRWKLDIVRLNNNLYRFIRTIDNLNNLEYNIENKKIYDYIVENLFKYIWDIVKEENKYYTESNFYTRHDKGEIVKLRDNCNLFLSTISYRIKNIQKENTCSKLYDINLIDYFLYDYNQNSKIQFSVCYCKLLRGCKNTDIINKYIIGVKNDKEVFLRGISTLVWKDKDLILFLYEKYREESYALLNKCVQMIEQLSNLKELKKIYKIANVKNKKDNMKKLCFLFRDYCELLLAFLRLREYEDFSNVFKTGSNRCIDIAMNIRKIDYFIYKEGYKEHLCKITRCKFNDEDKPKEFYAMSSLAYALNMYLTGETGSGYIRITEYTDEDEDINN